jgi:hypothetical protein
VCWALWEYLSGNSVQELPETVLIGTPVGFKRLDTTSQGACFFFFFPLRKQIVQREDVAIRETKIG